MGGAVCAVCAEGSDPGAEAATPAGRQASSAAHRYACSAACKVATAKSRKRGPFCCDTSSCSSCSTISGSAPDISACLHERVLLSGSQPLPPQLLLQRKAQHQGRTKNIAGELKRKHLLDLRMGRYAFHACTAPLMTAQLRLHSWPFLIPKRTAVFTSA